jgi:glycosyltransferase involved in cell wall biosynthesis
MQSNKYPLITIITAVLNNKKTIEDTIISVLMQNYKNIEYIILDGGSTDGTLDILSSYKKQINCLISEPDRGVYDAFNKGIDLANGDWIYFLGSDDQFADNNVLTDVFSKKYKSKMIYGNVIWGDTKNIYAGKFKKTKLYYQNICQQAIFYHRDAFHILGKFDLQYKLLADWVFNMRAFASNIISPVYLERVIAVYSTDGISLSNTDAVFIKNRQKLIKEIFGHHHYIYFKYVYWMHLRVRRLLKKHSII